MGGTPAGHYTSSVRAALLLLVAALHLVPIWSVDHVPTTDGPSHTYNAWILRQLLTGRPDFLAQFYEIDWRPHPNWLGHAFMAAAMTILPPVIAEKLLFSAIVLLFFTGAWMLGGATVALLAAPLSYHLLLQGGFYNYSLGVGLHMIVVAVWWCRRDRIVLNTALLLLLYFAHAVPAAMAVVSIFFLWLFTERRGRDLMPLIPVALLFGWFALHPVLRMETWTWDGALLLWPLWRLPLLLTFDERQLWLGTGLAILYAILVAMAIRQRRHADPFLLLALLCVVIYLAAPIGAGEGLVLKARFLIFPYLVVLGFLRSVRWPAALAVALAVVAAANVAFLTSEWRRADRDIARFLSPLQRTAPRKTLLPLLFERAPFRTHAVDYVAIERELIDFDNYQAALGDFPVKFRDELSRPEIFAIETSPSTVVADADYIFTWKQASGWRAPEHYRLLAAEGAARLYGR